MAALSHAADAKPLIEWQADHFSPLELSDHTVSGPMADPDGDALPNLHEYHFGADPRLPDAPAHLPVLERAGDAYTLRHRHALAADDSVAWLQVSPDLSHWITYGFEAEVARVDLADASEITLADIEGIEPETRFLRLRVDLAPFDFSLRAPSGLTLTLYSPTEWELAWNDLNLAETAYEIQRLSPRTGLWLPLGTTSPNQISWFDAEADASAGIKYRVLARDAYGNSLASDPVSPLDSDGDGLPDALELAAAYAGATGTYGSSPMHARDPFSGVLDSWAPLYGYTGTPGAADADSDGLDDLAEAQNHLDPFSDDTDRDGRSDAWELENGFDPLVRHSPYLLLPAGPLPISFSSDAKRIHFANSDGMVIEAGRYVILADLPTEHATSWYKSATFMGSSGLVVTKAADLSQEGNLAQRHYQLLVWPGDGHDPFKIKGVPSYDETYVSEGFPAQWSSNVRFNAIDLLGRVWCTVETGSNTHELRCYLSDGTYTVQTSGADYGLGFVTVLQSNGDTTIGYFDDWQNGIVGPFVGRPLPADRVDYLPLAVNRGGDILGDDSEPYFYTDRLDMDQRVLDAETASAKSLQNHLGTYVDHAFVTGNDGVRHSLPWDAMVITGFDDEANVYGRELDGRPVVWMADPEAWGHPPGTPRYTAAPYTPPVLPTGLKPLVNVRPDPLPRVELVQVGREDLAQNGLGWGQLIFPASLAIDYNRDGQIDLVKDTEVDTTSELRAFRFWSNDDDDGIFSSSQETEEDDLEITDPQEEDWRNNVIDVARDLEDFARLQLNIGGLHDAFKNGQLYLGFKWSDTNGTNPSIKLYRATDANEGTGYLNEPSAANTQSLEVAIVDARHPAYSGPPWASYHTVISTGGFFVLPALQSINLSASNPTLRFIFEGCTTGQGQLKLVILKQENGTYTEIGEGAGVWLDIKKPHEFIQRWTCGNGSLAAVQPVQFEAGKSGSFASPVKEEEKDLVLYVHGYNMLADWEKQRWMETTYKRLYWLGYKGRVGGFSWPCVLDDGSKFDASEELAWQAGAQLHSLLVTLKQQGYRVHLLGHSMGNIVIGEALRLAGPNSELVTTYIASQAAIAAHCYDASLPDRTDFTPSTPNVYGRYWVSGQSPSYPESWDSQNPGYLAPAYTQGAASKFVNFHNPQDWALTGNGFNLLPSADDGSQVGWMTDQRLKPNVGYDYLGSKGFLKEGFGGSTYLTFPNDRFTIFPYCAEARSIALGAGSAGGVFGSSEVNLYDAPFNFRNQHIYHSAQFRSFYAQRWQYWQRLMDRCDFSPRQKP